MRKIKLLAIFVFLMGTIPIFGVEIKRYYNYGRDWSEFASIDYFKTMTTSEWVELKAGITEYLKKEAKRRGVVVEYKPIKKLSQKLSWLCWQALGEYNIADNEVYGIDVYSYNGQIKTIVVVRIEKNGESFEWKAWDVSYIE